MEIQKSRTDFSHVSSQDLQKEVDDLGDKITDLNDQKYRLAIANPTADTSDIDAAIVDLNERLLGANQEISDRQGKLEQALLQFGKFHEAMASLLQWLEETRDVLENQGNVSAAEPKVVKAQMNEQKVSLPNNCVSETVSKKLRKPWIVRTDF